MKKFYDRYKTSDEKLRHSVALLPWKHNLLIMSKTTTDDEALFYASKTVELAWTRDVLLNYIKAKAYLQESTIAKSHNFEKTLPENVANYADEVLKSSYNLGFLGVTKSLKERELEKRLVEKIKHFILELGKGFSFIGNQYRLEYNEKEYYVDMLQVTATAYPLSWTLGGTTQAAETLTAPSSVLNIDTEAETSGQILWPGPLQMKGIHRGSLFCNSFILKTESVFYENHLLGARIDGDSLPESYLGIPLRNKNPNYNIIRWLN